MTVVTKDMREGEEVGQGRRADARRNIDRILRVATEVLSEDPGASMREVAERTGLARGTVYRHFPNRAALVLEIYRKALGDAAEAIAAAKTEEGPAPDAIRRVLNELVNVSDRYRFLAGRHTVGPGIDQVEEEVGAPLVMLIMRGQQEGSIRSDIPARPLTAQLAAALNSSIESVIRGELELEDAAHTAAEIFLNGTTSGG